jgi:hypothetical protein
MADIDWTAVAAVAGLLLAGATVALVLVTIRLGTFTKQLADANQRIARFSLLSHQFDRLQDRVELTESVLSMKPETWEPTMEGGRFPANEARTLRHLARLIDYRGSFLPVGSVELLLSKIDKVDSGVPSSQVTPGNFNDLFRAMQAALLADLPRLRTQLQVLTADLDTPGSS